MVFTVLPYQDPWEEYEEYRSILTVLLREYLLWRQSPIHLSEPGEWSLSSLMQRLNGEDVRRFTLSKEGERQYHQMMGQLLEREGKEGVFFPLDYLCSTFQIPWTGKLLVMCAFWTARDRCFSDFLRYCDHPGGSPRLSLSLALELFFEGDEIRLRQAEESYLPLLFSYDRRQTQLDQTFLEPRQRVMDLLSGGSILRSFSWGESYHVFESLTPLYGREKEEEFLVSALEGEASVDVVLQGETECGRLFLLRHACRKARKNLLLVSWKRLLEQTWPEILETLAFELRLQRAVCCLTDFRQSPDPTLVRELEKILRPASPVLCFRLAPEITLPELCSQQLFRLGELDPKATRALWENGPLPLEDGADGAQLTGKYRFLPGQIVHILNTCRERSRMEGRQTITLSQIEGICLDRTGDDLGNCADRLNTGYTMEDLILPPEEKRQIREGMDHIRYRYQVYDQWNFKQKVKYGRGLSMLFEGPPGTGKTMAASIIGNELGLPVFQIDLSRVLSKYIGETEKSLGRIFDLAGKNNAILFFDETDALFGKRSEIKDSHDKYANVETSFLLQKMEEYQGAVIMTTNLLTNIDSAFLRRISYIIHFPFPDAEQREILWKGVFPREAPLDGTVDLQFLAQRFEMTGAMIKNSALSAAFLAAAQDRAITMGDLLYAIQKQFSKHGKRLSPQDMGPYGGCFKESSQR